MVGSGNVFETGGQEDRVGQPHGANMSSVAFWTFFVAATVYHKSEYTPHISADI